MVEIYFLVEGHTKNVCDGASGHTKRRLGHTDVLSAQDMMSIIDNSSQTTKCILGSNVNLRKWKDFLCHFFRVPRTLAVSKFHVSSTKKERPGIIFAKEYSNSTTEQAFSTFERRTASKIPATTLEEIQTNRFAMPLVGLDVIPSAQNSNRKRNFEVNVVEGYYQNDSALAVSYFGDGTV